MKTKTAWKVTIASQELRSQDYLVTAGTAVMAGRRALKLARKEIESFTGAPYVQVIECRGTIHIFD